jgi:hypothetical protein
MNTGFDHIYANILGGPPANQRSRHECLQSAMGQGGYAINRGHTYKIAPHMPASHRGNAPQRQLLTFTRCKSESQGTPTWGQCRTPRAGTIGTQVASAAKIFRSEWSLRAPFKAQRCTAMSSFPPACNQMTRKYTTACQGIISTFKARPTPATLTAATTAFTRTQRGARQHKLYSLSINLRELASTMLELIDKVDVFLQGPAW